MMRRTRAWRVGVALLLLALSAAEVRAQSGIYLGSATGFIGSGGGVDLPRTRIVLGAAAAVNESSGWGADMDFSFSDDDSAGPAVDVTAFMLNANWTKPSGIFRPYVSTGLGVLRLHGCLSGCPLRTSTTDLGANAGGGLYVRTGDFMFVRGEVKYLWAPGKHPDTNRPDNFGFVRVTIGATLTWTIAP